MVRENDVNKLSKTVDESTLFGLRDEDGELRSDFAHSTQQKTEEEQTTEYYTKRTDQTTQTRLNKYKP